VSNRCLPYAGRTAAGRQTDVIDRLITAAGDTEPLLRRDALTALTALDDEHARSAVKAAATGDPDPDVREFAQELLNRT